MDKINMRSWIRDVINTKTRIAIPIMTHPGIELISKNVYEAVTNGRIHYESIKALDEKYPSAACTVIMDLTVEAEAFGSTINLPEDEIPTVTGRLVCDFDSVKALQVPTLDKGRVPEYIRANKLTAANISGKPVLAGIIGPFSLAGRLYDMSEIMIDCYCEPETATLLFEKCTDFLLEYCRELKNQGVQGVVIAEPAAGLLSNEGCQEFSSVYVKRIVDELQDDSFMVILHNCGNTGHCTPAMLYTGAWGYHFGNKADMVQILEDCPADVLVMGNLDPVTVFKSATAEEVKNATLELLNKTAKYPNFILSSGCDIPPHTPHENIEAFYEALNEFNRNNN